MDLTGNPQITYFKTVYRRHTNFSLESVEQTFNGSVDFGKKVTLTVSRNGDLIHRVYLQATLPSVETSSSSVFFRWVNYIGHQLIKSYEIQIGGQRIDKQYGDWLNIWNELTQESGKQGGYDNMVGNTVHLTGTGLNGTNATTLYVPLQFWFCRNPGLALPLIALQYHEVKIEMEFRPKNELYVTTGDVSDCTTTTSSATVCVPSLEAASLFIDYVYLDTDERRRFAQVSHEYLIEQLQFTGDESTVQTNVRHKLNFNHPCKELIWVVQRDDVVKLGYNQWNNYTDDFDLDSGAQYDSTTGLPLSQYSVFTNVEGGSGRGFPYTANATLDSDYANYLSNLGVGEASGTRGSDSVRTLRNGVNFPNSFYPGANVNNLAPSDFGTYNSAAEFSDHAGLGPRNAGRNPVVKAKLLLNGHDRFQERLGSYFNLVQPYQHHSNVPATGINVYSFALKPEEHQPSGTCNFSRIDNATLQMQVTPKAALGSKIRVYAINYNVLRIMSGINRLIKQIICFFSLLCRTADCYRRCLQTSMDKQCNVNCMLNNMQYNQLVQSL